MMVAPKRTAQLLLICLSLAVTFTAIGFAALKAAIEVTGTQHLVQSHFTNRFAISNSIALSPLLNSLDVGKVSESHSPHDEIFPRNSTINELLLRRLAQPFGLPEKRLTKSKRGFQGVCDQCWQDAICKGERFQVYMRSSIEEATRRMGGPSQSRWTNYPSDLLNDQWRLEGIPGYLQVRHAGISSALRALDISLDPLPNRILDWTHTPTGGSYRMIFNVRDGFLGMWSSFSPAYARQLAEPPLPPLPDLIQQSDVSFLEWQNQQNTDIDGKPGTPPKWIGRVLIENPDTLNLIDQALLSVRGEGPHPESSGLGIPAWPGITLMPGDDAFKALLSSPNGVAGVWFLIQRKEYFGLKEVVRIIIYQEDDNGPNMFMEIGDAQPLPNSDRAHL